MAITYTSDNVPQAAGVNRQITSGTLTIATNDIVTVIHLSEDHDSEGTLTISNSGTALTWNLIGSGGATANCRATAWWAKSAGNENRTVTVNNSTATTTAKSLSCRVHTGAHQTTPVPAGNVFSGTGATDVSQAITPTASGSALWMGAGDWAATNTFAAIANCTLDNTYAPTNFTGTIVRPTTQPRTDAVVFTLGETDTSGKIAWIAFEVQAAASAVSSVPANRPPRARVGMLNPGTPGNVMRAFFPPRAGVSSAALATITGTLATTNADDTSAAAGTTTVVGTLAKTNANDTSAAAGTTTVLGTLARTNANDTSAASGTTTVVGTLATTNANDTLAASGSVGAVSGTLARTNANDTSSAAGTTTVLGTLARTNANDSLSASGSAGAVTGSLAYTNNNDTCSAAGETPRTQSGVPGHRHRYVAYINGQQYVGPLEYIESVVQQFAAQHAVKAAKTDHKPKKVRIVVQSGKKVDNAPVVTEETALSVQKSVRDMYAEAYQIALNRLQQLEDDEEETLLMLI